MQLRISNWNPLLILTNAECVLICFTAQKMEFSIKYFFRKCEQIRSFLRFYSYLLKKYLIVNLIFCGA